MAEPTYGITTYKDGTTKLEQYVDRGWFRSCEVVHLGEYPSAEAAGEALQKRVPAKTPTVNEFYNRDGSKYYEPW